MCARCKHDCEVTVVVGMIPWFAGRVVVGSHNIKRRTRERQREHNSAPPTMSNQSMFASGPRQPNINFPLLVIHASMIAT